VRALVEHAQERLAAAKTAGEKVADWLDDAVIADDCPCCHAAWIAGAVVIHAEGCVLRALLDAVGVGE